MNLLSFLRLIPYFLVSLFIISFTVAPRVQANSIEDIKSSQKTLQESIKEQEKKIAANLALKNKLTSDLKKQETEIAKLLTALDANNKIITSLNKEINALKPQINQLKKQEENHQAILAKQLESTFKLGKTSSMELIFSGEKSERNERIITYFQYINEARKNRITQVKLLQQEITQKQALLNDKYQSQQILVKEQKKQHADLVANQKSQKNTINELNKIIKVDEQRLKTLLANEAALQKEISEAEKENRKKIENDEVQASKIKQKQQKEHYNPNKDEIALMARVSGIGAPKHTFTWPVKGSLLYKFGEPLQGELKWKGLVIKANEGSDVKAIAGGRVILANWLQGYGFIIAIDHGKNDMSLYGYNQRLLVNVGDNVEQGQVIALVGNTGGQNTPSLYFEVRRDGHPLDPSAWLYL